MDDLDQQVAAEVIVLHAAGSLPGFPGEHGAGAYLIDRANRTLTPLPAASPSPEIPRMEPSPTQAPISEPPALEDARPAADASA